MSDASADYEQTVATHDPDRMAAAFFAPAARRADLIALYGIRLQLLRVAHLFREPMAGHLRLAWWREQVARLYGGTGAAESPETRTLGRLIGTYGLPRPLVEALIDARAADLTDCPYADYITFRAQAGADATALMQLAARICGAGAAADALAGPAGLAQAVGDMLAGLGASLKRRHCPLPLSRLSAAGLTPEDLFEGRAGAQLLSLVQDMAGEGLTSIWEARKHPIPAAARAAILPAVLTRQRLALIRKPGSDPLAPAELSRFTAIMALGRAAWLGRV